MSEFIPNSEITRYFYEISQIPRGSLNEAGIAKYLVEFAQNNNLEYQEHPVNNVVIKKPASAGYEDHPVVMLQAHIDIVPEKTLESTHNFETDPLKLMVVDGWLTADGTTLGADDGYGVSYMLAILADKTLKHPALECVFTRSEEIGLIGAKEIDTTKLNAKRYINLDGGGEIKTTVSSSGGERCEVTRDYMIVENTLPTYCLSVTGLLGGHSGGMIDKERFSAIKLAFRILRNLSRAGATLRIVEATGGAKENAIARSCEVVFATDCEKVVELVNADIENIKNETSNAEPELCITLSPMDLVEQAACPVCSKKMVEMIDLLPQGLIHRDLVLGIPNDSLNLGILEIKNGTLFIRYAIRSPYKSYKDQLANQISDIAELFGGKAEVSNEYGGWYYTKESPLREILRSVLKSHGVDLIESATHGGLETGVFKEKMPDLDIITMGPINEGAHIPQERMNLESFEREFGYLKEVLENC